MDFLAQTHTATEAPATEMLANLSIGTIGLIVLILSVLRFGLLKPAAAKSNGVMRGMAEICESILVAFALVFMLIRPFVFQAYYIPSPSMETTLLGHNAGERNGKGDDGKYEDSASDHIFANKLVYRYSDPHYGDIAVFRAPKDADQESKMMGLPQKENNLIKRVIGLPGDTIEVKNVEVVQKGERIITAAEFRNGKRLNEPYLRDPMAPFEHTDFATDAPLKLGEREYFMMGDNRNMSSDSRYWGIVTRDRIIGKAALIFMPFNRFGLLH